MIFICKCKLGKVVSDIFITLFSVLLLMSDIFTTPVGFGIVTFEIKSLAGPV